MLSAAIDPPTNADILDKRNIYGRNEINVEVPSIPAIFYYEIFNPFYVFQLFSFILWMVDEYAFYATTILLITLISIILLIQGLSLKTQLTVTIFCETIFPILRFS